MSASSPLSSLLPMLPSPCLSPATLVAVAIALAALTIALFQAIALFLPSRSLLPPLPLPFAFNPRHRCSPTIVVAAAIALNRCCRSHSRPLRHLPPSSPLPSPTFSPLPLPSSKGNKVYSVSTLIICTICRYLTQHSVETKWPDKGDNHFFWQFRGDDHLFWQFREGFLMTISDGSFVRHLNLINTIVRFLNSCFI